MKKVIIILTFLFSVFLLKSQSCTDVEELLRKRHAISGMTYGHPYTTFDRHSENYKNLQNAINNIRNSIIKEKSDNNDKIKPVYLPEVGVFTNLFAVKEVGC